MLGETLLYEAYRASISGMAGDPPTMGVQEFREGLRARIDAALEQGEHTVVTRAGRNVAALVPYGWYEEATAGDIDTDFESLRADIARLSEAVALDPAVESAVAALKQAIAEVEREQS